MIDRALLPAALPDFGSAAVAAVLIATYLVVAEPYVGLVLHRRFEAAERRFEDARRWLYRRLLLLEWVLAGLCVATVAIAADVGPGAIGLRLPDGALGIALTVAALATGWAMLAATTRYVYRVRDARLPSGSESVIAMLPRMPVERRLFGMVAVTAGICEEIIFRGFLIAVVAAVVPAAPVWVCVVAAAVPFGFAHAYQGAVGVTTSLFIGILLGALYVLSGSLLAPIVLHALIDLRAIPLGRLAARTAPAAGR